MIYVDQLRLCLPSKRWPFRESCHLFADGIKELHAFAGLLQLKRSWFQDRRHFPHYDLTASKCRQAVRLGAIQASTEFVARRMRENKNYA